MEGYHDDDPISIPDTQSLGGLLCDENNYPGVTIINPKPGVRTGIPKAPDTYTAIGSCPATKL